MVQALKLAEKTLFSSPSSLSSHFGSSLLTSPSRSPSGASLVVGGVGSGGSHKHRKKIKISKQTLTTAGCAKRAIGALRECRRVLHHLSSYLLLAGSVTKASGITAYVERLLKTVQSRLVHVLATALPSTSTSSRHLPEMGNDKKTPSSRHIAPDSVKVENSPFSMAVSLPKRMMRDTIDAKSHMLSCGEEPEIVGEKEEEGEVRGHQCSAVSLHPSSCRTIFTPAAPRRRVKSASPSASQFSSSLFSASSFTSSASQRELLALEDCRSDMPLMFPYRTGTPSLSPSRYVSKRSTSVSSAGYRVGTPSPCSSRNTIDRKEYEEGMRTHPLPSPPLLVPISGSDVSIEREEVRRQGEGRDGEGAPFANSDIHPPTKTTSMPLIGSIEDNSHQYGQQQQLKKEEDEFILQKREHIATQHLGEALNIKNSTSFPIGGLPSPTVDASSTPLFAKMENISARARAYNPPSSFSRSSRKKKRIKRKRCVKEEKENEDEEEEMVWDAVLEDDNSSASHRNTKDSEEMMWDIEESFPIHTLGASREVNSIGAGWTPPSQGNEMKEEGAINAEKSFSLRGVELGSSGEEGNTSRKNCHSYHDNTGKSEKMEKQINSPSVKGENGTSSSSTPINILVVGSTVDGSPVSLQAPVSSTPHTPSIVATAFIADPESKTNCSATSGNPSTTGAKDTPIHENNANDEDALVRKDNSVASYLSSTLKLAVGNESVLQELLERKEEENERLLEKLTDMASELLRLTELQEKRSEEQTKKLATLNADFDIRLDDEKRRFSSLLEAKLLRQKEALKDEEKQRTQGFKNFLEHYARELYMLAQKLDAHFRKDKEQHRPMLRQLEEKEEVEKKLQQHKKKRKNKMRRNLLFPDWYSASEMRRIGKRQYVVLSRAKRTFFVLERGAGIGMKGKRLKSENRSLYISSVMKDMDGAMNDNEDALSWIREHTPESEENGEDAWSSSNQEKKLQVEVHTASGTDLSQPTRLSASPLFSFGLVEKYKQRVEQLLQERGAQEKALEEARTQVKTLERQLYEQMEEQEKFFQKISEYEAQLLEEERKRRALTDKLREATETSEKSKVRNEYDEDELPQEKSREAEKQNITVENPDSYEDTRALRQVVEKKEDDEDMESFPSSSYSQRKFPFELHEIYPTPHHRKSEVDVDESTKSSYTPSSFVCGSRSVSAREEKPTTEIHKVPGGSAQGDNKSLKDLFHLLTAQEGEVQEALHGWMSWEKLWSTQYAETSGRKKNLEEEENEEEIIVQNLFSAKKMYVGKPLSSLISAAVLSTNDSLHNPSRTSTIVTHNNTEMWRKMMIVMGMVLQQGFSVTASCYDYYIRLHEELTNQINLQLLVLRKLMLFLSPIPLQFMATKETEVHVSSSHSRGAPTDEEKINGSSTTHNEATIRGNDANSVPSSYHPFPASLDPCGWGGPSIPSSSFVPHKGGGGVGSRVVEFDSTSCAISGFELFPTIFTSCSQLVWEMIVRVEKSHLSTLVHVH